MAANTRTRLYRMVKYDCFVYATTKSNTRKHWVEKTGLPVGKIRWSRYKKIKMDLTELNKGRDEKHIQSSATTIHRGYEAELGKKSE